MKATGHTAAGALAFWVGMVALCARAAASGPAWQDAAITANGAALYAQACATCHGDRLQGQPDWQLRGADGLMPAPPHDASGHTWHHADDLLFAITKHGMEAVIGGGYRSAMPGFEDSLQDAEIRAILAYIKSTWPPEVIAIHDRINAAHAAANAP